MIDLLRNHDINRSLVRGKGLLHPLVLGGGDENDGVRDGDQT